MSRHTRVRKYRMDWLKAVLLFVGVFLFTFGARLAWMDAGDDFHMGGWGVLGSVVSGLGALALYVAVVI